MGLEFFEKKCLSYSSHYFVYNLKYGPKTEQKYNKFMEIQ